MDTHTLIQVTVRGLLLCLYVSVPVAVVSAATGLLVAFIQGVFSMQETMVAHVVKLLATTAVVALGAAAGGTAILNFAQDLLARVVPS